MSPGLADRLSAERRRKFAGRTAEKDLFSSALSNEPPFNVLYVFGSGGTIACTPTPDAGGMIFERDFVYTMPNPLLDRLVLRRRVEAESAGALRRLKSVLEKRAA
jgi:hypothetical protein